MLRILGVSIIVMLLGACSTMSVVSDYDTNADFSAYSTYRWPDKSEGIRKGDMLVENPLIYKRVQAAVEKELSAMGYSLRTREGADLIVHVHAGIRKLKTYEHRPGVEFSLGGGWYRPWWGPYGGYTYVSYYEEGSLVIDLIDARTRDLVWRGMATDIVREYSTPEKMQQDIDKAVGKILSRFPARQ